MKKKTRKPTPKKGRRARARKWPEVFLEHLAKTGSVLLSAAEAGITRTHTYKRRDEDPEFAALWKDALEIGVDRMKVEARRRAVDGTLKPVFFKGLKCGAVREFSDTLLIFLIKAHDPAYRDSSKVKVSGDPENPLKHDHSHTVTGRIDHLAAAFAGAADREEASGLPGDGAGEPLDPANDQSREHPEAS